MNQGPVKEELLARPLKLADLAGYQDHSVVSREIIRKSTGTVSVLPSMPVRA